MRAGGRAKTERCLVVAAILVAGCVWWWARSAGLPEPPPTAGASGASAAGSEGVAADGGRTHAPTDLEAGRRDAGLPAAGQRTRFVVRDVDSLAVVPGASVHYFPPRTTAQRSADEARLEREDRDVVLQEAGRSATTDQQGCVDVVVDPGCAVAAQHDDRYGELDLEGEEVPGAPRTIWLQRDLHLVVEVVDTAGNPCPGVRVDVVARVESRRHGVATFDDTSEPTDAAGRVVWRHLQCRGITSAGGVIDSRIDVQCAGSHLETVRRRVQIADLAMPVRLVVPPGGTVQLRMLDADGEPLANAHASLRGKEDEVLQPAHGERERVVFTQVPLGCTWRIAARVGAARSEQELVGPTRAGEVVPTELVVPVRRWQLRGRILWQGQPQSGMTVRLRGVPDDFVREREVVRTDAGGVFVLRGHAPLTVAPCAIVLGVTTQYDVKTEVTSTRELPAGDVDLGDLAVSPGCAGEPLAVVRLLADGRDVSATGWVQLQAEAKTPGRKKGQLRLHRTSHRVGPGGIEVHGVAVEGKLSLLAGAPGRWSVARRIDPGAVLTIELAPMASLRTSVLLPDGAGELHLVREEHESGRGQQADAQQWPWFHFRGLQPGRWCLEVLLAEVVVHRTPAFELVAGENVWPRDGSVLDLRGVARVVHVSVVAAATGRAIEECRWFRVAGPGAELEHAQGAPWFHPADGCGDVLVVAKGFVPQRVPAPDAELRLALESMTSVRVQRSAVTDSVLVRTVEDGVRDEVLREADANEHEVERMFGADGDIEMSFAPGTVLDVIATSGGVAAPARRIVVGTTSPQGIDLP